MSSPRFKTLHITNYYHKNSGGISTSYNNLLAAAGVLEREAVLIVPGEKEAVEEVNEYARIYYVPARFSPLFDKRYRIMMPWQYMRIGSPIREIMLNERPDLIEVTDKYTLSMIGAMIRTNMFKKIGRPILVHFSCERMDDNVGSFLIGGRAGEWFARQVIGKYTLPSFDFHIANSVYTAEEFHRSVEKPGGLLQRTWRMLKAPRVELADRVFVCPRGVNSVQFTPERKSDEARARMIELAGVPANAVVSLYAGRLSPEKNIGLLVEMMRELTADTERDHRLIVAGAGPQEEWLRKEGEKFGKGKIVLLGHLDKETLAGLYANADAFVHPNPKEPFGIAPLEAMASGVPTVAPRAGGILSYATDENAWLMPPDGKAFADAVRSIAADPAAAQLRSEKAVETARANTREAATQRLFDTYDRIYEDFHSRRELYTDRDASASFDHVELLRNPKSSR
ncbi:MAG: glycosyltransferase [Acidobacteria bacterium]|nr:glycosyltransferase [Acidobacteriota bacterium]